MDYNYKKINNNIEELKLQILILKKENIKIKIRLTDLEKLLLNYKNDNEEINK